MYRTLTIALHGAQWAALGVDAVFAGATIDAEGLLRVKGAASCGGVEGRSCPGWFYVRAKAIGENGRTLGSSRSWKPVGFDSGSVCGFAVLCPLIRAGLDDVAYVELIPELEDSRKA